MIRPLLASLAIHAAAIGALGYRHTEDPLQACATIDLELVSIPSGIEGRTDETRGDPESIPGAPRQRRPVARAMVSAPPHQEPEPTANQVEDTDDEEVKDLPVGGAGDIPGPPHLGSGSIQGIVEARVRYVAGLMPGRHGGVLHVEFETDANGYVHGEVIGLTAEILHLAEPFPAVVRKYAFYVVTVEWVR